MEKAYNFAETLVYGIVSFGNKLMQILNTPFVALPAYIGIKSDSPFIVIWMSFMKIIGLVDRNNEIIKISTLEVIIGPLLAVILLIGVFKFFKEIFF